MVRLVLLYATIFMMMVVFSAYAYGHEMDCERHPIFCQIVKNRPNIKKTYAYKLSNIIHKKAIQHKLDAKVFTAILAQESMYKVSAKNCTTGIVEGETFLGKVVTISIFDKCKAVDSVGSKKFIERVEKNHSYSKISVCTDFGIGQIWHKTAESYKFDIEKLTTDIDYSVEAAAVVLKDFKNRYSKRETDWWTRYNARSRKARDEYKELVERFISAD